MPISPSRVTERAEARSASPVLRGLETQERPISRVELAAQSGNLSLPGKTCTH
jgi:hypothetical protein